MLLAESLRDALPTLKIMTNYGGGNVETIYTR